MVKVTMDDDGDVLLVDPNGELDHDVVEALKDAGFECGTYFVSTRYGYPLDEVLRILSTHCGGVNMHVLINMRKPYHRVPSRSSTSKVTAVEPEELVTIVDGYNIDEMYYTVCDGTRLNPIVEELDAGTTLVLIDALTRNDEDD